MCCTVSFTGEWRIYIDDSFMLGEFVPSLTSKTFIYFTLYHLLFLDKLQKLRGIFTGVFRGYSQRPTRCVTNIFLSVDVTKYKRCDSMPKRDTCIYFKAKAIFGMT